VVWPFGIGILRPRGLMRPAVRSIAKFGLLLIMVVGIFVTENVSAQSQNQLNSRVRVAQDYERMGNFEGALNIYRGLYNLVPNNQLYYEGVKRNMLRLKMYDELIELIGSDLRRGKDLRLQADLANVYYKSGNQPIAKQLWNEMLNGNKQNKSVYIFVANALLDNRLYSEAIEVYKLARQNFKRDDIFVFELANIYIARLNYKEATLELMKHLEKNPKQFSYIEGRIASYTKDPDNAREVAEVLKGFVHQSRQQYLIRELLAGLYLRVGDYESSFEEFKVLENMPDAARGKDKLPGRELFHFAEQALSAGEYRYAQQAYALILSKYSSSPYRMRAQFGIALAKQKQGLANEALKSYDDLIRSSPRGALANEALFQKGEIYFVDLFEVDKALEAYHLIVQKYPKNKNIANTYFRIGDCYAAKGQLQQAQIWYEKPLKTSRTGQSVREKALFKSAYLDFLNGDFDQALEKLRKITDNLGETIPTNETYVNDALELIFLIEENKNASSEALKAYGKAQILRLQRLYSEAIKKLQDILENFPNAGIIDESLLDLGELESTRGNYASAIEYFQGLLKEYPESIYNALVQKRIGEIYEQGLGDFQKAREAYELVLINYPQSVYLEEVRQKLRNLQGRQLSN
jgi:tetratricopeptide (TPR) repeat protein